VGKVHDVCFAGDENFADKLMSKRVASSFVANQTSYSQISTISFPQLESVYQLGLNYDDLSNVD
jgi:hypothetical protein